MRSMDERAEAAPIGDVPSAPASMPPANAAQAGHPAPDARPADPSRPILAPATWLVGQLTESALVDPPWAVEQAQVGYIQMGQLAYHVAEQATGEQTIEEIAAAVSQAVQGTVTPQDVRAMVHMVLIPRGVLQDPDAPDLADDPALEDHPEAAEPEPLVLTGPAGRPRRGRVHPALARQRQPAPKRPPRELTVEPRPLEALSSVLMWLFWPPVMLVVAVVGLTELLWLFTVHGVAGSVIAVLSRPVLLPLALLLAGLVAGLAPLGRMIALYSGGATIQRLRLRLSLPLPQLTVEVADDYGLSRGVRLTVNVSGVYLQFLLTLGLCLLGIMTGAEFLFLTVTLLTLNMLRLLLPVGRAHADRLLADGLLVQEPLGYVSQLAGTYLPGLGASSLPPLKRWGYAALGLYLTAVTLLLIIVVLAVLWATPTLLATVWAAFQGHLTGLAAAIDERDVLGISRALANVGVLALTAFVLLVALVAAGWRTAVSMWSWASISPPRRVARTVGLALSLLLVVLFWVPINPLSATEDAPPRSLAGATWASLTPLSQGRLADLLRRE